MIAVSNASVEVATGTGDPLAPVVEDMGIFLVAGRVRDPSVALTEGEEAERLGFRSVWLSERYDLKEAGVLLSGVAARTTRLQLGTAVLATGSRHPLLTAAMAATMHAMYGGRFVLGLGRSDQIYLRGQSIPAHDMRSFKDYLLIVRRLLNGETVGYSGPLGEYEALKLADIPLDGAPPIWSVNRGGPLASRAAAEIADGVMFQPFTTVEAAATSVRRVRQTREELGLDPEFRICMPVVTACELDDVQTLALTKARLVTYVQMPDNARIFCRQNGWDPALVHELQNHPQFTGLARANADQVFHREQLLEPAQLIPDSWIEQTCAVGSVARCIEHFDALKAVGVDEIALYGSTPAQNSAVLKAWREHTSGRSTPDVQATSSRTDLAERTGGT